MFVCNSGQRSFLIGATTAPEKTSFVTRNPPLAPSVSQGGWGSRAIITGTKPSQPGGATVSGVNARIAGAPGERYGN